MNRNDIDAYLERLSAELSKLGASNRRFVEEARGHLSDAVEERVQNGMDVESAQLEALAQFGAAPVVARTFVKDKFLAFDCMVWLAALLLGSTIAYVDSRPTWDDTGVTALALVFAAAMCGFVAPRWPWRWALAAGIGTPLLAIARSPSLASVGMLLVLVFPFAGAYLGMMVRRSLLLRAIRRTHRGGDYHDKNRFEFMLLTRHGRINPELAAIIEDPDTRLVPFLERLTPSPLGPLGNPQSVTDMSESTNARVRKYHVVFGSERKVTCRIEIDRARKVSVHWARTSQGDSR